MTKNRFQITIDSTKASEIKALKRIAEKTGPHSYIGTLLTPEFLEWAEDRINSDFTLDIFYNGKTAERNYRKASEEIRELTAKVQRRDDEIEALKIARDIARHEAEESEGRYQDRIVERNREISELKAALNGKTEKISDLVHKSRNLRAKSRSQRQDGEDQRPRSQIGSEGQRDFRTETTGDRNQGQALRSNPILIEYKLRPRSFEGGRGYSIPRRIDYGRKPKCRNNSKPK
jgi:hypothetical protein